MLLTRKKTSRSSLLLLTRTRNLRYAQRMKLLFRPKPTSGTTFFCFTPLVSFFTFVVEFAFALYVFFKYRPTSFSKLCVLVLICLGLFQLSEFLVCTTPYTDFSIKMGYVAITLLPALGLHIINTLTHRWKALVYVSYVYVILLVGAILFIPQVAILPTCNPNYVSYEVNPTFSFFHWLYYVTAMIIGIFLLTYAIVKHIGDKKQEKWMIISYLVFIIPSLILLYVNVIENTALPSVMCGFAIITAIIFVFIIIPRHYYLKSKTNKIKKAYKKKK